MKLTLSINLNLLLDVLYDIHILKGTEKSQKELIKLIKSKCGPSTLPIWFEELDKKLIKESSPVFVTITDKYQFTLLEIDIISGLQGLAPYQELVLSDDEMIAMDNLLERGFVYNGKGRYKGNKRLTKLGEVIARQLKSGNTE